MTPIVIGLPYDHLHLSHSWQFTFDCWETANNFLYMLYIHLFVHVSLYCVIYHRMSLLCSPPPLQINPSHYCVTKHTCIVL